MPGFLAERCMDCGGCLGICPHEALDLDRGRITVLPTCTECDLCVKLCPVDALVSVHALRRASDAAPQGRVDMHASVRRASDAAPQGRVDMHGG